MKHAATLIIYAPNVHTGGGLVLLNELLKNLSKDFSAFAILDHRARNHLRLPQNIKSHWVKPSIFSRINGEIQLNKAADKSSIVFCFHGLPPIFPNSAKNTVFLQNKLYVESVNFSNYKLKTRIRLQFEKTIARWFRKNACQYIVQTPTMLRALRVWAESLGDNAVNAKIFAFADLPSTEFKSSRDECIFDFVYVANGEAHKNHRTLLKAWELLAHEGLSPSLALTLGKRDVMLIEEINAVKEKASLNIFNNGELSRSEITDLYIKSRALVFPSTSESFGLPLIEANNLRLPIIASELDYVRDVCSPVQTFDPNSAISLARAVKRHLGLPESLVVLRQPSELWNSLIGGHDL